MFQSIVPTLQKKAESFSFKEEILAVKVCDYFKEEIRARFGQKALPLISSCFFKDGSLVVKTPNPTFSQELQYEKEKLLASLNTKLKKKIIERIVFKI